MLVCVLSFFQPCIGQRPKQNKGAKLRVHQIQKQEIISLIKESLNEQERCFINSRETSCFHGFDLKSHRKKNFWKCEWTCALFHHTSYCLRLLLLGKHFEVLFMLREMATTVGRTWARGKRLELSQALKVACLCIYPVEEWGKKENKSEWSTFEENVVVIVKEIKFTMLLLMNYKSRALIDYSTASYHPSHRYKKK